MKILTFFLWALLPLTFYLVLVEITGQIMEVAWEYFDRINTHKTHVIFRIIGFLSSLFGIFLGYYWGYFHANKNGIEAFVHGIKCSIGGVVFGAIFAVMGLTFFMLLIKNIE